MSLPFVGTAPKPERSASLLAASRLFRDCGFTVAASKRRKPMLLQLLFLLLCLCVPACNRVQLSPLASDATILAYGDSLTYGTGAAAEENYPAILAALSGRNVVNAGVPGETSGAGRERLAQSLDEVRPQLLILCLGGNDFLRRLDPAETKENLRAMVQTAQERGIEVLLVAVPRLGFGLQVPDLYEELAAELKVPLEEESLAEILADAGRKSDPVHPNAAGYRDFATALHARLTTAGAL